MKKIVYILCSYLILTSCSQEQQNENTASKKTLDQLDSMANKHSLEQQSYFESIEEFKQFASRKWVDLTDENPCHPYSPSIAIKNDSLYYYTGIEPYYDKIVSINQVGTSILEFTIAKDSYGLGRTFKLEILDFQSKLVKWSFFRERSFNAQPYKNVCAEEKIALYDKPKEFEPLSEIWLGEYYYEENETGKVISIKKDSIIYEATGMRYYAKHQLSSKQVADTLALYFLKSISDLNSNLDMYSPLIKLYKRNDKYFIKTILTNEEWNETEVDKL